MAKKKVVKEKSKGQHVREYLAENAEATGPQIQTALAEKGIDVALPTIYQQINRLKGDQPPVAEFLFEPAPTPGKKRRKKKAGRKAAKAAPAASAAGSARARRTEEPSFGDLQEAKRLADQLGGVEQAKKALDALAKLR